MIFSCFNLSFLAARRSSDKSPLSSELSPSCSGDGLAEEPLISVRIELIVLLDLKAPIEYLGSKLLLFVFVLATPAGGLVARFSAFFYSLVEFVMLDGTLLSSYGGGSTKWTCADCFRLFDSFFWDRFCGLFFSMDGFFEGDSSRCCWGGASVSCLFFSSIFLLL